jgi:hypothetical protein
LEIDLGGGWTERRRVSASGGRDCMADRRQIAAERTLASSPSFQTPIDPTT